MNTTQLDYSKLTKPQKRVLMLMLKHNLFLVCNEGKDYKCWLSNQRGIKVKETVYKTTATVLMRSGWIEEVTVAVETTYFYHKLTEKGKRKLETLIELGLR